MNKTHPTPPDQVQPDQRIRQLLASSTYRLATHDPEFLEHDDLRAVRLQLEYLKPEWTMRQQGVRSTVIVFGSGGGETIFRKPASFSQGFRGWHDTL